MRSPLDDWRPWDPDRAAVAEGVAIVYWRFRTVLGLYIQNADGPDEIALRADLADPANARLRRQVVAHELGHRALHRGSHVPVLRCDLVDAALSNRADLDAERWGGERLCPPEVVREFFERAEAVGPEGVADLADRCGVTPEWLTWWLGDLRRRGVVKDEWGRGLHQALVPHMPNGRFLDVAEQRAARLKVYGYDPQEGDQ
ncbi:MAG TPA: hypothetical protein VFC93_00545 [Chloroflexota bacterium]|nr:hypothetical protein [Chloroflexota bacterium]